MFKKVIFAVLIPFLMASLAYAQPAELPVTGQTTCYDTPGKPIPCGGTGQDGDIQAGIAWPVPRFTANPDTTVTDNLTGLIWTPDGNAPGPGACGPGVRKEWQGALDYVACLNTNNYLGNNDWRLPNRNELESLIHSEGTNTAAWLNTQGFTNVQADYYWSSTSYAYNTAYAFFVRMRKSDVYANNKAYDNYVWPVRGLYGIYSISGTVTSDSTLAGVTMTLNGDASGTTTTDASGNYTFSGLANGSYIVTPSLSDYTFKPTSRAVKIKGANKTRENFKGQ